MLEFISVLLYLIKCTEIEVKETAELEKKIFTKSTIFPLDYCSLAGFHIDLSNSLCYITPKKAPIVSSIDEDGLVGII